MAPLVTLLAAACGGGDGEAFNPFATATPKATGTEVVVLGGTTPSPATNVRRTPTPADPNVTPTPYPAGPEGAVNMDTIGRKPTGGSEVGDSGEQNDEPAPIGPWVTPLITWDAIGSTFGEDRGEPYTHGGIDFRVDSTPGVDIYAVCDGFVAGIEYSETHGRYIVLKCPDKWTAVYGYLEIVDVKVDDDVVKGETILGTVGSFLHFELRWDFKPVDPDGQIQYHVRPGGLLLTPTPTPSATPEPTDIPEDTPTPVATAGGGGGGGGTAPTSTPTRTATPAGPPTATPTPSNTPTPEPTATPTPKPPTPTPTPLPQAF
ncbi:MAG: M23 family metallopeptidase [Dehalococcoidia bacterium]